MPSINVPIDPETIRCKIEQLIRDFEADLRTGELRSKVIALIPIFRTLRELGKSLIPSEYAVSGRDRILAYFQRYPETVINGEELLVISGIQEYARRIRELRVQFGWAIASGVTIRDMIEEDENLSVRFHRMKPDDYVLIAEEQDREAAHRWNTANSIRRLSISVREKILRYLRENVGSEITGEELRYVAGDRTEWARRVRELRTELGWPIVTQATGRPDLGVGVYMLEADRQSPEHDRYIPDDLRRTVLRRDGYRCQECNWTYEEWNPSDPRHLELHHIQQHVHGGENEVSNLRTLCNICHDVTHRQL